MAYYKERSSISIEAMQPRRLMNGDCEPADQPALRDVEIDLEWLRENNAEGWLLGRRYSLMQLVSRRRREDGNTWGRSSRRR